MRTLAILFVLVSTGSSLGEELFRFSSAEFSFRANYPIFVFDVSRPNSSKTRVCFAGVKSNKDGRRHVGLAIAEDMRDCSSVESFGEDERGYMLRAVLDGNTGLQSPSVSEEQQVKIKGKIWNMSDNAKAIVTQLNPNKEISRVNYICRLELKLVERIYEENAPTKNVFCKPIKLVTVQDVKDGKLEFDQKGNPVMIETVVCPLPKNCVLPDWVVTPENQFIPGVDNTTAHADLKGPAVVHTEPKPVAP